ncbi:MAG: hypothetical protein IJH32_04915 [Ruminococcus sp.]|nr:hypothetical protein [Ruminococcus sp.]
MIRFIIKKTGELKTAFSAKESGNKIIVQFQEKGKEYTYFKDSIEILDDSKHTANIDLPFRVYALDKICYRCRRPTEVITYIKYADDTGEDVTYPWNYDRLFRCQTLDHVFAHLYNPLIEYYGLGVLGSIESADSLLVKKYPKRIKYEYSRQMDKICPMNICSHCGAHQGNNYVYEEVNKLIHEKKPIRIIK